MTQTQIDQVENFRGRGRVRIDSGSMVATTLSASYSPDVGGQRGFVFAPKAYRGYLENTRTAP